MSAKVPGPSQFYKVLETVRLSNGLPVCFLNISCKLPEVQVWLCQAFLQVHFRMKTSSLVSIEHAFDFCFGDGYQ